VELMLLYQHEWELGKREIVWKHDARRAECFHTISSFPNFRECWYNLNLHCLEPYSNKPNGREIHLSEIRMPWLTPRKFNLCSHDYTICVHMTIASRLGEISPCAGWDRSQVRFLHWKAKIPPDRDFDL
jgi:hypothetical protein